MISGLQAAQLCQSLYDGDTVFDHIYNVDEVYAGLKYYPDCTAVIFRGSTTFLDWIRDFQGAMVQTDVGGVEMGFYLGLRGMLRVLQPGLIKNKPVIVVGHSLGGGRAHIFAALLVKAGFTVQVITFGAPRPGDATLKDILAPYSVNSYKNGNDFVTDVPIPIHPLLPYEHPRALIAVNAAQLEGDGLPDWGVLRFHHCQLYVKALQNG